MAICKNCGRELTLINGKCMKCGKAPIVTGSIDM